MGGHEAFGIIIYRRGMDVKSLSGCVGTVCSSNLICFLLCGKDEKISWPGLQTSAIDDNIGDVRLAKDKEQIS